MVSSFDELMQVQADVAVKVMRAHHSSWNKQYDVVPPTQVSKVTWDGTIQYNQRDVIEPLKEMFDRSEQQRAAETPDERRKGLNRFREGLRTVLHENTHLMAADGTSLAFPLDAFEGKAHKVFEEGVTERATRNELNNFIDALELERIAPGIKDAEAVEAYAAYVPAVDEFSAAVGKNVGLDSAEVVRRMAIVNAAEKFSVAAELLYDKHLSQLVPETAKADAVGRIAEAMHAPFAAVHDYDPKDPADLRMSALAGRSAFTKARDEVQTISDYWSQNQDLRRTLDAALGATNAVHKPQRDGRAPGGPAVGGGDPGQSPNWKARPADGRQSPARPARLSRD